MSVIHAPKQPTLDLRSLVFPVVIVLFAVVIFLRLWYYQVVKSAELTERAEVYSSTSISKLAPRGLIFDRKGELIAGVQSENVVTVVPRTVRKNPWVLEKVAAMVGTDARRLREKMEKDGFRPNVPIPVYIGVPIDVATRIAEARDDLPGVSVDSQPMRYYPDTFSFAHLLGYVWTPSEGDVKRIQEAGATPAPFVGKLGVERVYETKLMGTPGKEQIEMDAKQRLLRLVGREAPVPGRQLILSIDADLQRYAASLLKGYKGAVVALDPSTGEVLAAVSSPSFDSSLFLSGISGTDYRRLRDDPAKPMFNRALTASYMPGSTFKIVTTIAAVRKGIFNPNNYVVCNGGYRVGKRLLRCMSRHGAISFERAMEKSCNTYFADLAHRVGIEEFRETCEELGLGQRSGIDTMGEGRGIVPTEAWVKRWRRPAVWYPGDTLNLGIGQGDIELTPLQMANLAALVANQGVLYRPHLVRAVRQPGLDAKVEPVKPEELHRIEASPEFWSLMQRALVGVVEEGTAINSRIPGLQWGGKTGSVERRGQKLTNSCFVGFAPANNPRIAVGVVVEGVGHGSEFAAPIAKAVVQRYLLKPSKAASNSPNAASAAPTPAPSPAAR